VPAPWVELPRRVQEVPLVCIPLDPSPLLETAAGQRTSSTYILADSPFSPAAAMAAAVAAVTPTAPPTAATTATTVAAAPAKSSRSVLSTLVAPFTYRYWFASATPPTIDPAVPILEFPATPASANSAPLLSQPQVHI
jgi:hypothetical protein